LKGKILIALLISIVMLSACANENVGSPVVGETDDIKRLVQDYSMDKITDSSASITSEELIVSNENGSKTVYSLPKDEFFVSIAPYVEATHPCENHSLTGCQGELVEEDFNVYIQDEEGNVIVDEKMTTLANGFIDFWLPRDKTFKVKVEHDGKIAETEISTFKADNTCITTMQLM